LYLTLAGELTLLLALKVVWAIKAASRLLERKMSWGFFFLSKTTRYKGIS